MEFLAKFTDVPNVSDNNGMTPIHYAAFNGHLKIVEFLTKFTDDPNASDNYGRTPLYYAAFYGHTEIAKCLIGNGAEIEAKTNIGGWTPLYIAVENDHIEFVKCLVDNGALIDDAENDKNGETPLFLAVKKGKQDIVNYLTERADNEIPKETNTTNKDPEITTKKHKKCRRFIPRNKYRKLKKREKIEAEKRNLNFSSQLQ